MNNKLLIFNYNLKNKTGLDELVSRFDQKGFDIHFLDGIDHNFNIWNIPFLLDYLGIKIDQEHRLAVLSNIRNLIMFWYRVYNSLFDDFIYYLDNEEEEIRFAHDNLSEELYRQIALFNGISDESVNGKIYTNIDAGNYPGLINFLLNNNIFRYFDSLNNFVYNEKNREKFQYNKKYVYGQYICTIDLNEEYQTESVALKENYRLDSNIQINRPFFVLLENNPFIVPYTMALLVKNTANKNVNSFLVNFFYELKNKPEGVKESIYHDMIALIANSAFNFKEKIFFLSFIVILKPDQDETLTTMMELILADQDYIDYHYPLIINTLFYITSDKLKVSQRYYRHLKEAINKLSGYYIKTLNIPPAKVGRREEKLVAVVIDQMLSLKHSPTKLIIMYVNKIKEIYPDYQIKIYVEDNFRPNLTELISPHNYCSAISHSLKAVHQKALNNEIEIVYSNPEDMKKQRLNNLIAEIIAYNPEIILTTSYISLAANILYQHYPIVYLSLGAVNYSLDADIHLYADIDTVVKNNAQNKMIKTERIYQIDYGVEFDRPVKRIKRSDYNLCRDDFVLITVGNRLDAELDQDREFIDTICSFIAEQKNISWLIVGSGRFNYLHQNYCQLITDSKIINIKYEEDLLALYNICDLYVNPNRKGGGYSIAMAMQVGLPVVILNRPSDGLVYVGKDNSSGYNYTEYIKEILKLYQDRAYYIARSQLMRERIKLFSVDSFIQELVKYFDMARNIAKK